MNCWAIAYLYSESLVAENRLVMPFLPCVFLGGFLDAKVSNLASFLVLNDGEVAKGSIGRQLNDIEACWNGHPASMKKR